MQVLQVRACRLLGDLQLKPLLCLLVTAAVAAAAPDCSQRQSNFATQQAANTAQVYSVTIYFMLRHSMQGTARL
jgi:hypothetical protein